MKSSESIRLGYAGWSLPRAAWPAFPSDGTHLQRFAHQFTAVEINSSFYRPHRPATYRKWAASVPEGFGFCVKVPRQITHEQRLRDCGAALEGFLDEATELGDKLGCLLLQLPPSLGFERAVAGDFFEALRERYAGQLALEPRHASWLDADELLERWRIARVAADPSPIAGGDQPGGWAGMRYYRLHGSPRIYHSAYSAEWLERLAGELRACARSGVPCWCIFDNTASGAATENALAVQAMLRD
ncbi:DUF72 domain-containing protein [Stutzerimonas decontaminans]|uniref:DUF72 domain-containing protein n=2 Tax=Stutzerimonas TaxID=2901164 RepID=A0ABX4VXN0_9GAMM|nr:DUF72 domain-containing protein [Stutzerimonas decontaminans]AHY43525.1 hypothetical protein UIB01_14005 [Stutzerimonas decontaminans]MCQ4245649.1 DUF72 domain-containing protein [Stutzerimonas decontaminans]PNF84963.1 DUF72 domain-containing protein [Stutzerimonas decontaminans]